MADSLPPGAQLPLTFSPGDALTADSLNRLQTELLTRILTHTHTGNAETGQEGPVLGSDALADHSVLARHLAPGAVPPEALPDGIVSRAKLDKPLQEQLDQLGHQSRMLREHLFRLEAELGLVEDEEEDDDDRLDRLEERLRTVSHEIGRLHAQEEENRLRTLALEEAGAEQTARLGRLDEAEAALAARTGELERQDERERTDARDRFAGLQSRIDGLRDRLETFESDATDRFDSLLDRVERDAAADADFRAWAEARLERLSRAPLPSVWGHIRVYTDVVSFEDGESQNIVSAELRVTSEGETVELCFLRPYADKHYTVLLTPETRGVHALPDSTPAVAHRDTGSVRFGFWDGIGWQARNSAWNIVIFGALT